MYQNLYQNKFKIKSARLHNYDYGQNGYYFITICTKDKELLFGNVVDEKMVLNNMGSIAYQYWEEITEHFDNVLLDEYIIMPNHIHGIVVICGGDAVVETRHASSLREREHKREKKYIGQYPQMSKISPQAKSLSVIIGSYKSACTKKIRQKFDIGFAWQSRFYDHVIKNEKSLDKIRNYIRNNPLKWELDKNLSENIFM